MTGADARTNTAAPDGTRTMPTESAPATGRTSRARSGNRSGIGAMLGRMGLGAAGFAVVIAAWQLMAVGEIFGEGLLPTPVEVGRVIVDGLGDGLLDDLLISFRRVLVGVGLGLAIATPIGFVLGWFGIARAMFNPLVNFLRALPPIALVPLVIVYFGIGELSRGIVLVWAAFFATIVIVYEGVASLEEKYVRAAQTLGANRFEILTKVVFPLSVPHIMTAARVSLGIGWASLVAAELVAAQQGLGAVIQNASNFLDIPTVYAGIVLIGISALVMDVGIRMLSAYVVRWQDRGTR
ncbi:ABC transporter permease [Jiangella asiatica]|uniref:ABC transporter permease n=1 Tax=Jiangella asiatica TaxID=2530372 RepID=A0A4R5DL36_9ACTN|nr:ABC transporter permease [Jiangella asiatica]TDE12691.1 ABC transporter permease [Jiangella asiatica]